MVQRKLSAGSPKGSYWVAATLWVASIGVGPYLIVAGQDNQTQVPPGATTAGSTTAGATTVGGTTAGTVTAGTTTAGTTTSGTTGTPAAADLTAINNSLTAERLLVQFYNLNSNLIGVGGVVNPGTTAGTTTAGTTAGTTTAGTTTAGTTAGDTTAGTTAGGTTAGTTAGTTTAGTTAGTTTAGTTAGDTTTGTTTAGTTTGGTTAGGTLGPLQDTTAGTTTAGATTAGTTAGSTLSASLSGGEEVPPVSTTASGTATFTFNQDRTQLAYDVRVSGLSGPATAMHLHPGAPGEEGPPEYPLSTPDAGGAATGSVAIDAADVQPLLNGQFYLNVHTAANPEGEIRGQVVATQAPGTTAGTTTAGTTTAGGTTAGGTTAGITTAGTTTSEDMNALRGMVAEFQSHHQAHVALLEQNLGALAGPAPTFRNENLQVSSIDQFVRLAITLEDFAAGVHQQAVLTGFGSQGGTTAGGTQPMNQNAISILLGMALDDSRHSGALRGWRKTVSTADGGDPNTNITDEGALPVPRTVDQINQFLQTYISAGGTTTAGGTTAGGTTAGTTTAGGTTAGTTTAGGTTAGDTTAGTTTAGTTAGTTTAGGTTAGDTTAGTTTAGTTTAGTTTTGTTTAGSTTGGTTTAGTTTGASTTAGGTTAGY